MINQLKELLINGQLYDKLQHPEEWDSLIINRRKPYTYRVFTMIGTLRVCLHRFDECSNTESFIHPHAWPAAFTILRGKYEMKIGRSLNTLDKPTEFHSLILAKDSFYEMVDPLEWHAITPLQETHTIMINGPNYDHPHIDVRTTKGKDLEKMKRWDLEETIGLFSDFLFFG